MYYGMKRSEKPRSCPPISTTYATVAEKLDEGYLACLVSEAMLTHTRSQFSREVATFSAGCSDFAAGEKHNKLLIAATVGQRCL